MFSYRILLLHYYQLPFCIILQVKALLAKNLKRLIGTIVDVNDNHVMALL